MKRSTAHYERVAAIYRDALNRGEKPGVACRAAFPDTGSATVNRWIKRARDLGLLEPVITGGLQPWQWMTNHKLRAVADALNVDPTVLAEAIVVHARGDLRVKSRYLMDSSA